MHCLLLIYCNYFKSRSLRIDMKQDSVLFQCFFIDYPFYYAKQSYLHGKIWNYFISNLKFIDKAVNFGSILNEHFLEV